MHESLVVEAGSGESFGMEGKQYPWRTGGALADKQWLKGGVISGKQQSSPSYWIYGVACCG